MKCVEKTISVLVVLAMAIFMISGCDSAPDETVSSGATSEELNLYIIGSEICDKSGTKVENGCSIDEKGNIVDDQGRVLIAAGRTEAFSYVKSIYYEKEQLLQEIKGTLLGDGDDSSHIAGKIVTEPKSFRFRFTVEPKNAVKAAIRERCFSRMIRTLHVSRRRMCREITFFLKYRRSRTAIIRLRLQQQQSLTGLWKSWSEMFSERS